MIELGLLCLIVVAFLVDRDRRDKRAHEQLLAHRLETAGLTDRLGKQAAAHRADMARLFDDHRAEVAQLCQRIQAPEHAIVEHAQQNAPDDRVWPLTDQEAAEERDKVAAAVAEIERMEREGVMS